MAVPFLKSTFKVCVDEIFNQEISGRVYNPFVPQSAAFSNYYLLIEQIEAMIEFLGFPQSAQDYRSFGETKASFGQSKGKGDIVKIMEDMEFEKLEGEKATFVVQVQFRQNATWQGTISWMEQRKEQKFRSALELIKLMDSAISESTKEQQNNSEKE